MELTTNADLTQLKRFKDSSLERRETSNNFALRLLVNAGVELNLISMPDGRRLVCLSDLTGLDEKTRANLLNLANRGLPYLVLLENDFLLVQGNSAKQISLSAGLSYKAGQKLYFARPALVLILLISVGGRTADTLRIELGLGPECRWKEVIGLFGLVKSEPVSNTDFPDLSVHFNDRGDLVVAMKAYLESVKEQKSLLEDRLSQLSSQLEQAVKEEECLSRALEIMEEKQ